ncbi:MAG: phosphatase PAP2 family protein [Planctomycetota bacterium]
MTAMQTLPGPLERRARFTRERFLRRAIAVALVLVSAMVFDALVLRSLWLGPDGLARAEALDVYRYFRVIGWWPTWLIVGLALVLTDLADRPKRPTGLTGPPDAYFRGVLVAGSAALAGISADLLKLFSGRVRPASRQDGQWVVLDGGASGIGVPEAGGWWTGWLERGFLRGFADGSNLAFPSSHAATAFGGAIALAFLMPRLTPLLLPLAAGCALTRLLAGAHWLSDVVAGAMLGYAAALLIRRWVGGTRLAKGPLPSWARDPQA